MKKLISDRTKSVYLSVREGYRDDALGLLAENLSSPDCKILYLNIGTNNPITDEGVEALAGALSVNTTLYSFELHGGEETKGITDRSAIAFAEALEHNTTLQKLELNQCNFTSEGARALLLSKRVRDGSTFSLNLSGNTAIGAEGLKALAGATLKCLTLYSIPFGNEGAAALAETLRTNAGTFHELELQDNQMTWKGIESLAEALKHNTTLKAIKIYGDQVTDTGAAALAETLRHNTTLTDLALNKLAVSDMGGIALAEALRDNNTLSFFVLGGSPIGDPTAMILAETIKANKKLRDIRLFHCKYLQDVGVKALAEALKTNSTLEALYLEDTGVGDVGAQALAETFKVNTTLEIVSLYSTNITPEGKAALQQAAADYPCTYGYTHPRKVYM